MNVTKRDPKPLPPPPQPTVVIELTWEEAQEMLEELEPRNLDFGSELEMLRDSLKTVFGLSNPHSSDSRMPGV